MRVLALLLILSATQVFAAPGDHVIVGIRSTVYEANIDKVWALTNFTGYTSNPFPKYAAMEWIENSNTNFIWYVWDMRVAQLKKNGFTKSKFVNYVKKIAPNAADRFGAVTNLQMILYMPTRDTHPRGHPQGE